MQTWYFWNISGYDKDRSNYAYCPLNAEYRTIDAYVHRKYCPPGPSKKLRRKAPYFSNPNVYFEGVATGSSLANNAKYMTDNRFYYASKGTNCLDGEPNEKWMTFSTTNNLGIGKICGDDDSKYTPRPPDIKYRDGFRVSKRISNGWFWT